MLFISAIDFSALISIRHQKKRKTLKEMTKILHRVLGNVRLWMNRVCENVFFRVRLSEVEACSLNLAPFDSAQGDTFLGFHTGCESTGEEMKVA
jgi:hypothetical protein